MKIDRRDFVKRLMMILAGAVTSGGLHATRAKKEVLNIYCQHFTWLTFFERENKDWEEEVASALQAIRPQQIHGLEIILDYGEQLPDFFLSLSMQNMIGPSVYLDPCLHRKETVEQSLTWVLQIADRLRGLGVNTIVLNPETKSEDPKDQKNDRELSVQAQALDRLGAKLRSKGIRLLFHNHLTEMQRGGREFYHCLNKVAPENMGLCLDADWVHRGLDSTDALYGVAREFSARIDELHLRQTVSGVWSEVFGEGDIDYSRIADILFEAKQRPMLVLEQAVDDRSPHTMTAVEAIQKSTMNVQEIFKGFSKG